MEAKVYKSEDTNLEILKDKTIAVIGFGSQGHAHALNLKESGMKVLIGLYEGSKSKQAAESQGLEVVSNQEAVKQADIIFIAVPDTKIAAVYNADIKNNLNAGKTLLFSHGFAVHYNTIEIPEDVNVIMAAPKGPGHIVRRMYQNGQGIPALIAVHQDPSGNSKEVALAWTEGIGCARAGVIETSFKEETETDLFGEQTVLCGGLSALIQAGFETLVEADYQPEMAYFECLHETKLIVDLMYESGISGMRFSISDTAKWGDVHVGPKIITDEVKKSMKEALTKIQNGEFAKEWIAECESGQENFNKLLAQGEDHQIEKVGQRLRSLMPWFKKREIKGAQSEY